MNLASSFPHERMGSSWTCFKCCASLLQEHRERYDHARTTCERYSAPDTNLEPFFLFCLGERRYHVALLGERNGITRATENGM